MYNIFRNGEKLKALTESILNDIEPLQQKAERIGEINQLRVLNSFRNNKISDTHFNGSTGYGYDDFGREALEAVFAEVFGGESALVRPQIISGTHAITLALFGVLRPGDELIYITGKPYE